MFYQIKQKFLWAFLYEIILQKYRYFVAQIIKVYQNLKKNMF